MSYYIGPFLWGWDSLGSICNCSSLKLLTLFLDLIDTCCSPWGEVDKSNGVIYLLMQKRAHIFLARSSGFKGFQKRSFLKGKTFLGASLFYKRLFSVSLIAGELQPHIECRIKIVFPGGGFEGRITSVPIQFYFVVKEWCKANTRSVQRCSCCFCRLFCFVSFASRSGPLYVFLQAFAYVKEVLRDKWVPVWCRKLRFICLS